MAKLYRDAQLDWYNYLGKALSNLPSQAHSFIKRNISYNSANFLQKKITITPPLPRDPICTTPPPPNVWLVMCLIRRVRNFRCIFLKGLLLYQLTSRQHFYFGRY